MRHVRPDHRFRLAGVCILALCLSLVSAANENVTDIQGPPPPAEIPEGGVTENGAPAAPEISGHAGESVSETTEPDGQPATASPDIADNPWTRFIDVLSESGVTYDTDALEDAALRAMLRQIDRNAALLTADEAERQLLRDQGLQPVGLTAHEVDPYSDHDNAEPPRITPITFEIWPHGIAYAKVQGLHADAGAEFAEWIDGVQTNAVSGLIIDLRNAGGRHFDSLDRIAGFFMDAGTPLYKIQSRASEPLRQGLAADTTRRWHAPTMLLTGGNTSQAAELLAAILRDASGVMLLGDRTRGDPRLRELHQWSEDRYLYLPVAEITTERHPDYDLVGVVPHVTIRPPRIPAPGQAEKDDPANKTENGFPEIVRQDPVISRAVDILIGLHTIAR